MSWCLDTWAVIAWMKESEPAATIVRELLEQDDERPIMSWINLGEVSYIVSRREGSEEADEVVSILQAAVALDIPAGTRVLQAARLKAAHPISYADAFAAATATAYDATLLTGDPELLECNLGCRVRDLR